MSGSIRGEPLSATHRGVSRACTEMREYYCGRAGLGLPRAANGWPAGVAGFIQVYGTSGVAAPKQRSASVGAAQLAFTLWRGRHFSRLPNRIRDFEYSLRERHGGCNGARVTSRALCVPHAARRIEQVDYGGTVSSESASCSAKVVNERRGCR